MREYKVELTCTFICLYTGVQMDSIYALSEIAPSQKKAVEKAKATIRHRTNGRAKVQSFRILKNS